MARAERRETGGDAEFSSVLALSEGAIVAKGTSAGVEIWLCAGCAGTLNEDSKVEGAMAGTDMRVGESCPRLAMTPKKQVRELEQ
jgi:hypothetical protein